MQTSLCRQAQILRAFQPKLFGCVIQEANIQIALSPSIVAEYRRVSKYSKFAQFDFPPEWLEFMLEGAMRFPDGPPWPHPLPGPDDAGFLSLAKTTRAWLITGNLRHYPAESRVGIFVRTPAEYAAILDETA